MWMDKLGDLIKTHHYPSSLILNMDETMLHPGKNKFKVLVRSQGHRPTIKMEKKGEHITFALCIAANGSYVKPLIILPLKTLPELPVSFSNFYAYSGQANGWIDQQIYQLWVKALLIPYVQQVRKQFNIPQQRALLIIDGHNSREDRIATQLLRENNIDELCLPAHSSTVLQPLDLTVNGEFKKLLGNNFSSECGESNTTRRIRLLGIAGMALQSSMTILNIVKGFAKAGIHPFSRNAPLNSALVRDPLKELVPPKPVKKVRGVSISGQLITDGFVIKPLTLPPPTIPVIPITTTVPIVSNHVSPSSTISVPHISSIE
jgi:hypothetical protein